jgi:hypothetical protein
MNAVIHSLFPGEPQEINMGLAVYEFCKAQP